LPAPCRCSMEVWKIYSDVSLMARVGILSSGDCSQSKPCSYFLYIFYNSCITQRASLHVGEGVFSSSSRYILADIPQTNTSTKLQDSLQSPQASPLIKLLDHITFVAKAFVQSPDLDGGARVARVIFGCTRQRNGPC
jgi:hypothetical protein